MLNQASERIDLHEVFRLLRRDWALITACVVLLGAAFVAMALSQPKQYSAEASLLFRDPAFDQKLFGSTFFGRSADPDREAATNVALVGLEQIAERTAARGDIDVTRQQVQASVTVEPAGRSDVVTVRATLPDPDVAASVANAFATEFVSFRREADQKTIFNAQRLINQQVEELRSQGNAASSRANTLRMRAEQLYVLGSLQTGNAELVQRAKVPAGASAPRPLRNMVAGLFLGALLGIGLVFVRSRIDRRLRTVESLQEALDRPVLARVPLTDKFKGGLVPQRSRAEEAFNTLWTNLRYFNVSQGIDSILVTSPTSGDGKSTVALNLAAAAARSGSRVLVIETDLRRPSLTAVVVDAATGGRGGRGGQSARGLTQVLAGRAPFEQSLVAIPTSGMRGEPRNMDVLLAGPIPPNPAEMLESAAMRELLTDARALYDLVVIDTPPLLVVPDAVPLLRQVSAVLVVGRLDVTTRDAVGALKSQLTMLDAPLVGAVANQANEPGSSYHYYGAPSSVDPFDLPQSAPRDAHARAT